MKRVLFWGLIAPALLRRLAPRWLLDPPMAVAARHPWMTLGLAGAALVAGGLAVSVSGVIPVKASAGHWALTERFLQFSQRRSVATHSIGIRVPPLEDRALVLRGAGHYDLGCRPCHGGAQGDRPAIALRMLPVPPALPSSVPDWSSAELFSIVKHGLKFTGMPAWPAQGRDDEIWAVVAFLRRLPDLSADEYERLAGGDTTAPFPIEPDSAPPPDVVTETCSRCHGVDGTGRGTGAFPVLAGQRAEYLDRALRAYADGRRHSGIMGPIAAALTAETRDYAVRHYAARPAPVPAMTAHTEAASRGARIARQGVGTQMIPACVECHGPSAAPKNPAYPRLAGQYAEYLALQLRLLQLRQRGGSEYVHLMHSFVDRLTSEQIEDVAQYFASSAPSSRDASDR